LSFSSGERSGLSGKEVAQPAINLETGMERDEDGVVLGSTRLSGSQRLHR
jgi:hypothetical protein